MLLLLLLATLRYDTIQYNTIQYNTIQYIKPLVFPSTGKLHVRLAGQYWKLTKNHRTLDGWTKALAFLNGSRHALFKTCRIALSTLLFFWYANCKGSIISATWAWKCESTMHPLKTFHHTGGKCHCDYYDNCYDSIHWYKGLSGQLNALVCKILKCEKKKRTYRIKGWFIFCFNINSRTSFSCTVHYR